MKVTTKGVLKYTLLPGILPQIRRLFASGFGQIAFFMAQIYGAARLLPPTHPYLNAQNIGRFGITNVVLEAYQNLTFSRKHIDQIAIFFLLLSGFILLIAQFALFAFAVFVQTGNAAGAPAGGYAAFFVTQNTTNDIAHILMDRVFGIPDMFNSCVSQGIPCLNSTMAEGVFPFPYHAAFQDMLAFYSIGLCVVGVIIFMYYIVTILVETAQTGTPFGRRFNHVWAPIRMVVALALLVPIAYGMNGAQLLTLNVAKWGSALATNGWATFATVLVGASTNPLGSGDLVAAPQKPKPESMFQFYSVLAVCKKAYATRVQPAVDIRAYMVRSGLGAQPAGGGPPAAQNNFMEVTGGTTWAAARDFYENGDIIVVFGERDPTRYANEKGNVRPWCGEILLKQADINQPGSIAIQTRYFENFIVRYWENASTGAPTLAGSPNLPAPNGLEQDFFFNAADRIMETTLEHFENGMMPSNEARIALLGQWTYDLGSYIQAAVDAQIGADGWLYELQDYGWAGAGIWYNRIAELNGALISGIANIPEVRKWPLVMEAVAEEKAKKDKAVTKDTKFVAYLSDGAEVELPPDMSLPIATALASTYGLWLDGNSQETSADGMPVPINSSKNVFVDFVQNLFGLRGLYNMRDNANIHPLAQIVIMGKYLLEASIRNIGGSALGSVASVILGAADMPPAKAIVDGFSSLLRTVGMMTLSIGFVLYYVVPFLPFIYFFFQVGGWIKALFEAMVGLPLWALAHIRIDGEGLPGSAAMNGYFLIFEIFLRPILTIFGMIAGISIFAAQVQVLNEVFTMVVSNLTGFDKEGALKAATAFPVVGTSATVPDPNSLIGTLDVAKNFVDQLFYTVVYAIFVYMMAMSSFKLVYLIPDNMLRWMGSSVDGFGELAKDSPEGLVGTMYGGASTMTGQIGGAFRNLMMRR